MSKGKLAKFADMEAFENVFQYPYSVVDDVPFEMKGKWREMYFHNDNPIVLELGCGKGEYTVELAKLYPEMNFIGVDIKAPVCGLEPRKPLRKDRRTWLSCVPTLRSSTASSSRTRCRRYGLPSATHR